MAREKERPKIGLVLGGGGAKGMAHLGVLKVLEEAHFPIDYIAGTSVGAFIGGAYASGVPLNEMIEVAKRVRWNDLGRLTISKMGWRDSSRMEDFIREHFPARTFEELRIPLAVVAADICTGQMRIFTSGDLARAIRASCAIPGFFTPVIDEAGRMLVDGGIVANLPTLVAISLGADRVIAVNVNAHPVLTTPPTNVFQLYFQSLAIMAQTSQHYLMEYADVIVTPDVGSIFWDELDRAEEAIRAGEEAMRQKLPACRQLLRRKREGLLSRLAKALIVDRRRAAPLKY
ncbi:MAG TPA: patatin-like phospholipase family protein [Blastocatellia bacterium]|nr:patatin-like phospholipase family protein [Blastocatellia bacterium]